MSGASSYDYIALNANIRYLYNSNCEAEAAYMRKRFDKYGDAEDRITRWRAARGCGTVLKNTVDRIDNIKFNTCVCSIKHPLTNKLLRLSELLDKGILPFNGSPMEQPAQVMELLDIVDNAKLRESNIREGNIKREKTNGRR